MALRLGPVCGSGVEGDVVVEGRAIQFIHHVEKTGGFIASDRDSVDFSTFVDVVIAHRTFQELRDGRRADPVDTVEFHKARCADEF